MPTTWEQLTANIDIMRSGNEDMLSPEEYDDETLVALNKKGAKVEMKLDIEQALSIEYDNDGSTLDDVTDRNVTRLSRALAFKQLSTYYQREDNGENTITRIRWQLYKSLYERERLLFGGLTKDVPSSSVTSNTFKR
jgi:hypothetical protein